MNTHTFIHLGDLHLHPGSRNEDRRAAIDQIIAESQDVVVAAWLVPGDLFHSRSTIDDRNWLASRIQAMATRAPVVICYGNHDLPGDLDLFALLAAVHPIFVIAVPHVLRLRLATGVFASIAILPYPTRAGILNAGVASPAVGDVARDALGAIFRGFADQLEMARAMGDITLFIGHVNVAGSITSVGQPNIGQEIEIDGALLSMLGPIYKGLNHIHKGQTIGGAWYPGSICRMDYGEIEEKHYLYIEIPDDADLLPNVTTRRIDVAPMYHIEGWLDRDGFTYEATAGPGGAQQDLPPPSGPGDPSDWTGCDIRVRYRMQRSERSVLNEKLVTDSFPGARRLQLDPIIDGDRDIRAPEVAEARTLADKLVALFKTSGQEMTDGLRAKLSGLEHQPATQVLTAVQALITRLERVEAQAFEEALL